MPEPEKDFTERFTEKQEKNQLKPKIMYLGWKGGQVPKGKKKHDGVMTVAYRIDREGFLHFGFVFCSPLDPFSRKEGRKEALKRMRVFPVISKKSPSTKEDLFLLLKFISFHDLKNLIVYATVSFKFSNHLNKMLYKGNSIIPSWSKKWWKKNFIKEEYMDGI